MVFILDWLFPRAGRPQRDGPIAPPEKHVVLGTSPAQPEGGWKPPLEQAIFGLGCFWGAERKFWTAPGVHTTSVGYAGGMVPNPRYRPVCSGRTGHAEVVNVVFDQSKTSFEDMLDIFWDAHDPTTKNRQGNDVGSQYRSAIFYYNDAQRKLAEQTRDHFNDLLKEAGRNACTTEIKPAGKYYFAEEYHQQYLHKNPTGYCGLGGTGLYRPLKKAASE
ncbi:unnamed protein product [Chondrus crispus]|uniref:peptide-methionine (S)-S-oxide reductase n=1 Tax=Chondrus crispus TaxID=2769 RepID=R7QA15_CHOCR|nr:unnamed protein product [Chondrus crispus]CDF34608.1 unnamed protein product [Chondrus crispus]|eukprot:XP_005714427.1 unnamed protein product [Chondrus crispus]